MKTNPQRSRFISQAQLDRVAIIITGQWEEVMMAAQQRITNHQQEQRLLWKQSIKQYQLHRDAA
jgi:hypothetical protein